MPTPVRVWDASRVVLPLALVVIACLALPPVPARAATPTPDALREFLEGYGLICLDVPSEESGRLTVWCDPPGYSGEFVDWRGVYGTNQGELDAGMNFEISSPGLDAPDGAHLEFLVRGAMLQCEDDGEVMEFVTANAMAPPFGQDATYVPVEELQGCAVDLRVAASGSAEDPVNQTFLWVGPPAPDQTPQPPVAGGTAVWLNDFLDLVGTRGLVCDDAAANAATGGTEVRCDVPGSVGVHTGYRASYSLDASGQAVGYSLETATPGLDPPDGAHLQFLVDGATLMCEDDSADLGAFITDNATASPEAPSTSYETDTCVVFVTSMAGGQANELNQTFVSVGAPTLPTGEGEAPVEPAAPQEPGAEEPGVVTPPAGAPAAGDQPVAFDRSVPAPSEISADPLVLLQSALLAVLVVFLMPFPGQLFNSTLETHEDEVRRWLRLDRLTRIGEGIGAFWTSWPGVAAFTLLATLLYGFLDPTFGLSVDSAATFLGMLVGIIVVTVLAAAPMLLLMLRHRERPQIKVVPVSLMVGVACVLVSRLTDFQPGYVYGLLIGLAFARELSAAEEGRTTAIGAAGLFAVAMVAWLALGLLPDDGGFGLTVLRTALAALMVAGLEGMVFGLMPLRFLPGASVMAWSRVAWGFLLGIGLFAFFHILINPASGYLSDSSRTPLLTTLALLIGFSALSVAFWAWFRFRNAPPEVPVDVDLPRPSVH
ncbi:MAG TPA: FGLLP motif-containing membrane protein [Candidatus Limnocylindria bacterium]|nr:FGLLP motif-containing membrane protein [Candidatus Limnocylindria bacterium]